jgi:hypothetical protein
MNIVFVNTEFIYFLLLEVLVNKIHPFGTSLLTFLFFLSPIEL